MVSQDDHPASVAPMTVEDDIAFFERVPTLNLLGRQALRILAIGAQTRYVHGGEVLFRAGEEADGGFVVQEGRFSLAPAGPDEEEAVVVGPFALLGEIALFTREHAPGNGDRARTLHRAAHSAAALSQDAG